MTEMVATKTPARFADYIRLARFDHMTKHVFVLPGIALAYLLRGVQTDQLVLNIVLGFVVAITIASANYVINEWLDRDFDKHHPTKSARAAVNVDIKGRTVWAIWAVFVAIGLAAAAMCGTVMLVVAILFAGQGIVYNVQPFRTKDRAFLDVLSESVNNPFRLLIGWAMLDPATLPPSSIILAYWMGGAFLMAAKRMSEYREITVSHGRELLVRYRRSFAGYTEISLATSCFAYALVSVATFTVFLVKYRIEYVLVLPFLCGLFSVYFAISMPANSVAQAPEKLFSDKRLMLWAGLFAVSVIAMTFIDVPGLAELTDQHFIAVQ